MIEHDDDIEDGKCSLYGIEPSKQNKKRVVCINMDVDKVQRMISKSMTKFQNYFDLKFD